MTMARVVRSTAASYLTPVTARTGTWRIQPCRHLILAGGNENAVLPDAAWTRLSVRSKKAAGNVRA
jgi:hypothetical protein